MQSRYYDPKICRFINADVYASTGQGILGSNMFAYCLNNPVNRIDCGGLLSDWWANQPADSPAAELGRLIGEWLSELIETYPSKEEHYSRNENNPDFPDEYDEEYFADWDDSVSAACHQFTAPQKDNIKFVSIDGMYEVIYDRNGFEVTDPKDVGTYNYISPKTDPVGHIVVDVIPWIIHGNSPDDTTKWWQRMVAFFS
mgnify:CR=1 FL=1